jgi:hypothetical protein
MQNFYCLFPDSKECFCFPGSSQAFSPRPNPVARKQATVPVITQEMFLSCPVKGLLNVKGCFQGSPLYCLHMVVFLHQQEIWFSVLGMLNIQNV